MQLRNYSLYKQTKKGLEIKKIDLEIVFWGKDYSETAEFSKARAMRKAFLNVNVNPCVAGFS